VPKNILIFSDGTGQAGGLTPDQHLSNVYKLYRAARTGPDGAIDPKDQVAFYDPGLGTQRDEGRIHIRIFQAIRKGISAGLGAGITRNIADCYEAILKYYEPGDRIFLFGFSRGAYTARCVAGVMSLCGIPMKTPSTPTIPRYGKALRAIADEAVQTVYEHGAGHDSAELRTQREEQARRFRDKYGSDLDGKSNASPYFIGVFDSVASLGAKGLKRVLVYVGIAVAVAAVAAFFAWITRFLGYPFKPTFWIWFGLLALSIAASALKYSLRVIWHYPSGLQFRWHLAGWHSGNYDESLDNRIWFVRHALAIDETRADFARVHWGTKGTQGPTRDQGVPEWFEQIWFAGCHSDIGGSYAEEESRLSDIALAWMLEQTTSIPQPILVDSSKLHLFPDASGMQHSEVEALRDSYWRWVPQWMRLSWPEKPRVEAKGAPLHPSVYERFKLPAVLQYAYMKPYRPENLRGGDPKLAEFY